MRSICLWLNKILWQKKENIIQAKEDLLKWYNEDYCLKQVKQDGWNLQYAKNQTEKICLEAIKQSGFAL